MMYFVSGCESYIDFDENNEEIIKYLPYLDYFDNLDEIDEFIKDNPKISHIKIYQLIRLIP